MNWDYVAGFIDADGSLNFYREGARYGVCLTASQQPEDRYVIDMIQEFVGLGSINERPNGQVVWRATGYRLLGTFYELEPRLVVKRSNAQRIIEFIECRTAGKRRAIDEHCLKLVQENRRPRSGREFLT